MKDNTTKSKQPSGPRSDTGKRRSSKNAIKHGLTATTAVLEHESQSELDALRLGLLVSMEPIGHLEQLLAERVVQHAWRLRRFGRVEIDTIQLEMKDTNFDTIYADINPTTENGQIGRGIGRSVALEKISRYEVAAERALFRCLQEFWTLQNRRQKSGQALH